MIPFKSVKKIVSLVTAFCLMSVACLPISASAEQFNETVQTVSNDTINNETETLYQRVLDLGFSEEEADYCFANLSTERIKFWLDCNINLDNQNSDIDTYSNDVSVVENSLKHPTYTNTSGWNTVGTCGSVASTILLQYYKTYHNDKVGLEKYKTPEELYHAILPYIDTDVSKNSSIATMSSNVASLTDGLKNFFTDNGEPHTVNNIHYNKSASTTNQDVLIRRMYITIDMCISTDKPVIAGGHYPNDPRNTGHFVVVQGFKGKCTQDSNGNITLNSLTVTVNTGWGGSNAVETIDFIKFIKTITTLGGDGGVTWLLP